MSSRRHISFKALGRLSFGDQFESLNMIVAWNGGGGITRSR